MKTYRDGHPVVTCDGCNFVIEDYNPKIHNMGLRVGQSPSRRQHACSIRCVKKIRANRKAGKPAYRCPDCVTRGKDPCTHGRASKAHAAGA